MESKIVTEQLIEGMYGYSKNVALYKLSKINYYWYKKKKKTLILCSKYSHLNCIDILNFNND